MPQQPDALTVLLANESAEEIKSAAISMRGVYPGCRVEAVYSVDEALDYAAKQDWHVILLDEHLAGRKGFDILPELRTRAPASAIILQADSYDTPLALQALRVGADHCVCKKSPAFLTELTLAVKQQLDKRDLRLGLGMALERYCRLTESLNGIVYELDPRGRFVSVNPSVTTLLGYQPEEIIGAPYTTIVHPEWQREARYRFNERRTAARATRHLAVKLVTKHWHRDPSGLLDAELSATGLYAHHTHLGTIGLLQNIRGRQQAKADAPDSQISQSLDRLLRLEQSLAPLAAELSQPLIEILRTTEALLSHGRPPQMVDHLQQIALQAIRAAESAKLISALVQPATPPRAAQAPAVPASPVAEPPQQPAGGLMEHTSAVSAPSISDKPKAPPAERRNSARVDLLAEASLSQNQATYQGVALNISRGGLYMILNARIAAAEHQLIHVGLVSGPAILEIQGRIRQIRQPSGGEQTFPIAHHTGLAIEFQIFDSPEELVLASLIDELRERSISVTVTASLSSEGSKALRFQAEAAAHANDWAPAGEAMRGTLEFGQDLGGLTAPSDYWRLLDHIHHVIGNLEHGGQLLEAGCGNGAFAAFLLIQQAYTQRIGSGRKMSRPHYVGIDAPVLIDRSKHALDIVAHELHGYMLATGMRADLLNTSFCSADLNHTLPFRDDRFDRIVCNLVIGYLQDPLRFLRELMRVLAPTGQLVLTSLNPRVEPSLRFTDPVHHAWEETGSMEWLWGSLVHLDRIEREGTLRSPDKQELTHLVTACGAVQPRIYSALADQAFIVVTGK